MKLLDRLYSAVQILTAIILIFMSGLVLFQVLARYVLHIPVAQTEELARYSMIWVALLGSALAIRTKTHVAVNVVCDMLPAAPKKILQFVSYLCIAVFCCLLIYQGWILTGRSMMQTSPSMPLRVGYIIAVIPASGVLGLIFALEAIVKEFFPNLRRKT